jgi:hypothetical protein
LLAKTYFQTPSIDSAYDFALFGPSLRPDAFNTRASFQTRRNAIVQVRELANVRDELPAAEGSGSLGD